MVKGEEEWKEGAGPRSPYMKQPFFYDEETETYTPMGDIFKVGMYRRKGRSLDKDYLENALKGWEKVLREENLNDENIKRVKDAIEKIKSMILK